ncbi:hypothetical protein TNCV_3705361 [Trichonephila clavipes]|nr:hypothetical protein TNCV_3705361 [Trichonephila clavipes]
MTTCIPGINLQQFQVKKTKTRPSLYGVLPSPAELGYERTDVVFSSFSVEWSRDLKTTKEIPVVFKYRNSVHVEEEKTKELLEVITAERLETEQQQKLEQQEQLSIEKLRLEIELSRNANQSAI